MASIEFTAEEKNLLVPKLKQYMKDELGVELGSFDAEFMLDFVTKEIAPSVYNKGLHDALAALQLRMESFSDSIYELEKVSS